MLVDSVAYASQPLALKVLTFDIDTTTVEAIFPIKDIVQRPMTFVEVLPLSGSALLIVVLCVLVPYLLGRYHDNKPILRRVTIAPKLPPHQVALQEMERISNATLLFIYFSGVCLYLKSSAKRMATTNA